MKYFPPLFIFMIVGCLILMSSESFTQLFMYNAIAHICLFIFAVSIPIYLTGRLSYVDIGWPLGLVCIGLVTLYAGEGTSWRVWGVAGVYLFAGLRMGLGALDMWRQGFFKTEFPRYNYQRMHWEKAGKTNIPLAMQVDAWLQGIANMGFLAFPAFVISSNTSESISVFEVLGLVLWLCAFVFESVSDMQKMKFLEQAKERAEKNTVCDVGLWQYSRHPNYFGEWMVWNALVVASIPSWLALKDSEHVVVWIMLGLGVLFASRLMYMSLVYITGAKPAEYYSLQKRPGYKAYTERVNMFFPWKPKK